MSAVDELLAADVDQTPFEAAALETKITPGQTIPAPGGFQGRSGGVTIPPRADIAEGEGAGFTTSFKSNFVTDPRAQLRILATDRFPDLSPNEAMSRFGFINGDPVFVNDEGNLEQATGGFVDLMGSIAAESPEMIGSVIGAFNPVSPVAGAALGAAGGEAVKRILANVFLDDPQTMGGNALAIAGEGALDLAFGGIAKGGAAAMNRRAIAQAQKGFDVQALLNAQRNIKNATGIELDIAQVSGLEELKQLKRWASKQPSQAAEIIQASDELIAGQVDEAVERVVRLVSEDTGAQVGIKGINAAKAAITAAKTEVQAAASPLYKAAYEAGGVVDVSGAISLIDNMIPGAKGTRLAVLKQTRKLLDRSAPFTDAIKRTQQRLNQRKKLLSPEEALDDPVVRELQADLDRLMIDDTIAGVHAARREVDAAIELKQASKHKLSSQQVADMVQIREELSNALYEASPGFREADEVFADGMRRLVDPLVNSPVGVLAALNNSSAARAGASLFRGEAVDAESIRITREAVKKAEAANPELAGAWDGMVAQWVRAKFDRATKELASGQELNVAGKFRNAVIGTRRQKAAMNEALGPGAVELFDNVMDAIQKAASTPLGGSETAFFQAIDRKLQGGTFSFLQALFRPTSTVLDAQQTRFMENLSEGIARGLTDPAQVRELNRIFAMKPGTERALLVTSLVLGNVSAGAVGSMTGPTVTPGGLNRPPGTSRKSVLDEL